MKEHFGLSDASYSVLLEDGVTIKSMFKSIPLFDTLGTGKPITKVNLYYLIDKKGDFMEPPFFPYKKIAKSIFDSLPIKDKIQVAEYADEMSPTKEGK